MKRIIDWSVALIIGLSISYFGSAQAGVNIPANGAPYFRAFTSGNHSVTSGTATKVTFDTKSYDPSGAFDNVTNYRFTPQRSGIYDFETSVVFNPGTVATVGQVILDVRKNGSTTPVSECIVTSFVGIAAQSISCGDNIQMNGTTDYVEIWITINGATPQYVGQASGSDTFFNAFFIGP